MALSKPSPFHNFGSLRGESVWAEIPNTALQLVGHLVPRWCRALKRAWADNSEGRVEWEPAEEDAERTVGWRLLDTYFRETSLSPTDKPDAVEVPVEADLKEHGLPKLIGILDLVHQRQIIDFKTSSSTPNPEKIQHATEVQTSSYSVLYRHNTGQKEAGIQLHHLVKLKNPKVVITALPPMSDHQ